MKRHLPPWMLRFTATDPVRNSDFEVKTKQNGMEELPTEGFCEVQQQSSEVPTSQSESMKTDSGLLKKCKTTRREVTRRAKDHVSNMNEGDVGKENHAPSKRKRKVKVLKAAGSNATEESTLSEDELSVDDLISIAEEYVNAEKEQERQKSSLTECESNSLPKSIFFKDKSTHIVTTPSIDSILNVDTMEASSSDEHHPSERGAISSSKTGDPAQDMLDLYLGPLLKRSDEVARNPEPVTKSVTLNHVHRTQDGPVGAAVPVHKKKGSLKDKVAMLLC